MDKYKLNATEFLKSRVVNSGIAILRSASYLYKCANRPDLPRVSQFVHRCDGQFKRIASTGCTPLGAMKQEIDILKLDEIRLEASFRDISKHKSGRGNISHETIAIADHLSRIRSELKQRVAFIKAKLWAKPRVRKSLRTQ